MVITFSLLRVWENEMHWNNENWFGNYFFIYPKEVHLTIVKNTSA